MCAKNLFQNALEYLYVVTAFGVVYTNFVCKDVNAEPGLSCRNGKCTVRTKHSSNFRTEYKIEFGVTFQNFGVIFWYMYISMLNE